MSRPSCLTSAEIGLRGKVGLLKAERLDVADTLKTFAEHVTRLAAQDIQRLGARATGADRDGRPEAP